MPSTDICWNCEQPITLAADGAWEDESGASGCGSDKHEPTGYRCMWLIQVASNREEIDFPEDMYDTVKCGAATTFNEFGSWRCEHGHSYVTYDDPARGAYDAELAFIERMEE